MRFFLRLLTIILICPGVLLHSSSSLSQPVGSQRESESTTECITVISKPENARITIKGSTTLTSRTPTTFCSLDPGVEYTLNLEKKGFESRTAIIAVLPGGRGIKISSKRTINFTRSLAVPGWSHFANSRREHGVLAFASTAAAAAGVYIAYDDYADQRDEYRLWFKLESEATTEAEKKLYRKELQRAAVLTNKIRDHMIITTGILGWVYATNLVETLLLSAPPVKVSSNKGTIILKIPRKSRQRAMLRSVMSPGMGQMYLGHNIRGFLFHAAFLGAAFYAADSWKDYEISAAEHELVQLRLEEAGSIQEIEIIREEMDAKWDDMRNKERMRNASLIALGSVWLLNILDVLASREMYEHYGFELKTSCNTSGLETSLTLRF